MSQKSINLLYKKDRFEASQAEKAVKGPQRSLITKLSKALKYN